MGTRPRPWSRYLRSILVSAACALGPAAGLAAQTADLFDKSVLRTIHLHFTQQDWWTKLHDNQPTETWLPARLTVDGHSYPTVGVRFRGASSFFIPNRRMAKKLPLRIGLDAFVADQRLYGRRSLCLNNGFWDPTFMREALAMDLMREFLPTPRVNWVKVYINDRYWGLYINVEAPNKDFLATHFFDHDGDRFKADEDFRYRGSNGQDYQGAFPLVSAPRVGAHDDLARAMAALGIADPALRIPAIESRFDVDLALRLLAANAVFANPDAFPKRNYYLYADPYHGRLTTLPWDANFAWLTAQPVPATPPVLADDPEWRQRYRAYVRAIAGRVLDWPRVRAYVDRYQALIEPAVRADPNRLYRIEDFRGNLHDDVVADARVKSLQGAVAAIAQAIAAQPDFAAVDLDLIDAQRAPRHPTFRDPTTFRVRADAPRTPARVTLHVRVGSRFASHRMFDDGKHDDGLPGDQVYGVQLPPLPAGSRVAYHFTATSADGGLRLLPAAGAHRAFSYEVPPRRDSVLIHEFLASNQGGLRDGMGEDDDWIELVNPTAAAIRLDGMFLTDDLAHPRRWALPADTILQPGASLLIWADGQPAQGPLHAGFKLSATGESIALYDRDGTTQLDAVTFGAQAANVSTGRLAKPATAAWVTFAVPTPHQANDLLVAGVRSFSALRPADHRLHLQLLAQPRVAAPAALQVAGAGPHAPHLVLLGSRPAHLNLPWPGRALLLDPGAAVAVVLPADATGALRLASTLPNDHRLGGMRFTVQALAVDGGVQASNAVEFRIRP